jgi:hypothetical protein
MSLKKISFMAKPKIEEQFIKIAEEKGCKISELYRDALEFYLSFNYAKDSKDDLLVIIEDIISKKFAKFEKRIFSLFIKLLVTSQVVEELNLYTLEKVLGYKIDNEEKKKEIENLVIAKIKSKNPDFVEY